MLKEKKTVSNKEVDKTAHPYYAVFEGLLLLVEFHSPNLLFARARAKAYFETVMKYSDDDAVIWVVFNSGEGEIDSQSTLFSSDDTIETDNEAELQWEEDVLKKHGFELN